MAREMKKLSKTAGLVPGTLVHVGKKRTEKVKITVFDYDEKQFQERAIDNVRKCFPYNKTDSVTWINIDGVHDLDIIRDLGTEFNIHPLILEDIVNTAQRPKMEDMGEYIFIVLKMIYPDEQDPKKINIEQVSLIVGRNYVISFQEEEGDVFDPIRDRIRHAKGRIRKTGTDYLAYSLLDAVIDTYFSILEGFGEEVEALEEVLASDPKPETLQIIHRLKRINIFLRKSVWPLREIINGIMRVETGIVKKQTMLYFRDIYDHTIQVMDTIEATRDMVSGMLDVYLSSQSNKMNEVMKVLTIFAAIFIPLTFIAGIYGMNFNPQASPFNMPELNWKFGYFFALGLMLAVALVMLAYFKRKKWF